MKQPRYIIRLGENLPQGDDTLVERTLFYVPDQASFVFTQLLRGKKGSDASNIYDEEINDDVLLKSIIANTNRKKNFPTMRLRCIISGS